MHHEHCFGCGTKNPSGLHLKLAQDGPDAVAGTFVLRSDLQGPPEIGHGGVLALALDEAMSLLIHVRGTTARTAALAIEYHAPAPVGARLEVRASLVSMAGSRLYIQGSVFRADRPRPLATGTATFVAIGGDAP